MLRTSLSPREVGSVMAREVSLAMGPRASVVVVDAGDACAVGLGGSRLALITPAPSGDGVEIEWAPGAREVGALLLPVLAAALA